MRLLRLELFGFKSFADRTCLEFGPGITGVVGPNGCGKSNVVDAIRWVLGELNPRTLRGKSMTDVIFHGNKNRRPAAYAEVMLTFLNDDRMLPVDADEVQVGRRLHRNGDSEYLLTGERCRLKDIRALFMDTGVGMDTYSVMEQGKVDKLLQANTKDRRFIFEEAAGISKFKSQRLETTRRLERVQTNVDRLQDVLAEVDSRVKAVRAQARKAEAYRELEGKLQDMGLTLAHARDVRYATQLEALLSEQAEIEESLRTTRADRKRVSEEHDALEAQVASVRDTLEETRRELVRTREQAHASGERVALGRRRLEELDTDEQRYGADQERLEGGIATLETELARIGDDVSTLSRAREVQTQDLEAVREQEIKLRNDALALEQALEDTKQTGTRALEARAAAGNELAAVEAEARTLDARKARIAHRRQELEQRMGGCEAELSRLAGQVSEADAALGSLQAELAQHTGNSAALREALEEIAGRIATCRDRRARATSRTIAASVCTPSGPRRVAASTRTAGAGSSNPARRACRAASLVG